MLNWQHKFNENEAECAMHDEERELNFDSNKDMYHDCTNESSIS